MLKTVLLIIGILLLAFTWISWPFIANSLASTPDLEDLSGKNFIIAGHRGAAGHAPENTMVSFKKAMELGADWVELDVHLSKDGQLMVIHDPTVDRTTDGTGAIADLTYAEIRKLDAGSWFAPAFAGEKVPSLAEVIREVNGQVTLLVELKWPEDGLYEQLGNRVAEEIRKYGAESWCIIQSFESEYLNEAASLNYPIPLQKLLVAKTSFLFMPMYQDNKFHMGSLPAGKDIQSINYFHEALTKGVVAAHHADNKMVIPYTLNTRGDMLKALGMGVDGVITDFPDIAKKLRDDLLQHGL